MNLYAEENLKSISLLIGGEKSMTLQEFISKKEKEDLKIYNLLKDDILRWDCLSNSSDNTRRGNG